MTIKEELDKRIDEEAETIISLLPNFLTENSRNKEIEQLIRLSLQTGANIGMGIAVKRLDRAKYNS